MPAPPRTASADPWDERPVKQADGGHTTPPPAPAAASPPALTLRWGDAGDAAKRPSEAGAPDAPPPTRPLSADGRPASAGSAPPAALEAGPPPPDWPADLPVPDALTDADLKELGTVVPWAGPYASAALRSKAWALRDAGLTCLVERMKAGGACDADAGDRREWARCVARVLASAARDRVPAVAVSAAGAVTVCVECLAAAPISSRDATVIATEVLPILVDRATDGNARVAAAAAAAVTQLARARSLPLSFGVVVKPVPSNAPPKAVAARLALLAELLPVVGVSGGGGDGDASSPSSSPHHPLDATAAMKLAVAGLTSSSADVRASAVSVAAAVAVRARGRVLALIPDDVNPKLKAAVVEAAALEGGGGGGVGGGGNAAAAAPAAPRREAPTPTRAAAAKKVPPPSKKAGLAATASTKQDVAVRAGSVGAAVPAAPPPPSLHPTPQPPLPLPTSDPAPYEAELASREAALGPAHPRVADALCALAAVHTARGERGAAQRLLGRALGVYEAACGPASTDAAAALTDLGVLHMEAWEDGVGRPLLARALAIQEAALGRDHPDAVAIRAVLEAE